ncbi:ADP-ribosylglycohydrolase family protein [Metallumcola ferriviriculae]|uniref:ADP-ribosylglycohydrolase family protein n=1 Tax=Metallumcola ferriviriculae TaxID=3039180 RepID=A0AAU0UMV0_9FIRM|nr:ADP-ribosylglycohydrolase family protein [Desulfitibacteraceae bacterium MK1]
MYQRVAGGMFGVALGDALGATLEFMSAEEVKQNYGIHREIIGGGWLDLKPGEFTDDTEMTLSVAEGIVAAPDNPVGQIGKGFIDWFNTGPKDVGNTIRTSLSNYVILDNWDEASKHTAKSLDGKTAGNGALMRTLPISFAYYGDPEKIADRSRRICRMTHWDMIAEMAGVFYNILATCLMQEEKQAAWDKSWDWFAAYLYQEADVATVKLLADLKDLRRWEFTDLRASGFVYDTLVSALWCFYNTDTAEEAIINAVNLGDDADTVGAVTGGLAGVYYGYQALPQRWLRVVKQKDRIEQVSRNLHALCCK